MAIEICIGIIVLVVIVVIIYFLASIFISTVLLPFKYLYRSLKETFKMFKRGKSAKQRAKSLTKSIVYLIVGIVLLVIVVAAFISGNCFGVIGVGIALFVIGLIIAAIVGILGYAKEKVEDVAGITRDVRERRREKERRSSYREERRGRGREHHYRDSGGYGDEINDPPVIDVEDYREWK